MIYNTKKPAHAGDGLLSGVGNIVKGSLAAVATPFVATLAGAKSSGAKGAAYGLAGGCIAGGLMLGTGVVTGAT